MNTFARADFAVFRRLMHFDFGPIEQDLNIDCFSTVCHYQAIPKRERMYNRDISQQVRALRAALAEAADENAMFDLVTDYYRRYGYGVFAMSRAFRIRHEDNGTVTFLPISNIDGVMLDDLLGYEKQKQELRRNTETFLAGKRANNVLLYGDAGTCKSTSVKALINEYFDRGLRMIEIYKHQFQDLSAILAQIKNRNYRFIIFIDDLSFEENEVEYKFLKAVIEGGVETRPDNVLIYATSNRRHLIRETWNDRTDMEHHGDIHRSDTVEEKLSLASRFGVAINYNAPTQKEYQEIVRTLAAGRASPWTTSSSWPWPTPGKSATAAFPAARPSSLSTTWRDWRRKFQGQCTQSGHMFGRRSAAADLRSKNAGEGMCLPRLFYKVAGPFPGKSGNQACSAA